MKRLLAACLLLFGLNSCLLFWQEVQDQQETDSSISPLALAALISGPSGKACTAPQDAISISGIFAGNGIDFFVSPGVVGATEYRFYGRVNSSGPWVLVPAYTTSASAYDASPEVLSFASYDQTLTEYYIVAVSNGCEGLPSNIMTVVFG